MNQYDTRPTTQEPVDEEERELMDPDTWDWDTPIEVRTVGTPGAIIRLRFTRQEIAALDRIARDAGANPVELIHQVLREWIAKEDSGRFAPRTHDPARSRRAATG
jgi:hypothetical protein